MRLPHPPVIKTTHQSDKGTPILLQEKESLTTLLVLQYRRLD